MREFFCFAAVSKETRKTDPVKPFGKDMQQKPPDKFSTGKQERFLLIVVSIILITQQDTVCGDSLYTRVADGCTVGITGKVFNCIAVAVKSLLKEGKPVDCIKVVNEFLLLIGIPET